jgi:hypothetical protein
MDRHIDYQMRINLVGVGMVGAIIGAFVMWMVFIRFGDQYTVTIPQVDKRNWFCTKGTDVDHCEQWSRIDRD